MAGQKVLAFFLRSACSFLPPGKTFRSLSGLGPELYIVVHRTAQPFVSSRIIKDRQGTSVTMCRCVVRGSRLYQIERFCYI